MREVCLSAVVLSFVLLFFPTAVLSAHRPDPSEQLRPFVAKMTKMIADADLQHDRNCDFCKRLIDLSKERFDYNEMSKRVLGKTWRTLSPEEKNNFVELFTALLQYAYVSKIRNYSGQSVVFKKQRIRGKRAEVKTEFVDKERTIPLSYILLLEGDQWMVYDVVIEGVSLVRNYMEQFRDVVRKQSYSGLVKKIEKKVKVLEEEQRHRHDAQTK